jgi:hypothetical protein
VAFFVFVSVIVAYGTAPAESVTCPEIVLFWAVTMVERNSNPANNAILVCIDLNLVNEYSARWFPGDGWYLSSSYG